MTPDYALQDALVRAFKAAGTAAGQNVFDKVPAKAVYPRVVIGPSQVLPVGAACFRLSEVSQQVDVWSTAVGFGEVRTIAGALVAVVEAGALSLVGHVVAEILVEETAITRQPDGITSRARIAIRALIQPAD